MKPLTLEEIAHIIYLAIAALNAAEGQPYPAWEDVRVLYLSGTEHFVDAIIDGDELAPEDAHQLWVDAFVRDGWVYGPTRDYIKKTHPSLVPFSELSLRERAKDAVFIHLCKALTPFIG
jgi:hypothetical protein